MNYTGGPINLGATLEAPIAKRPLRMTVSRGYGKREYPYDRAELLAMLIRARDRKDAASKGMDRHDKDSACWDEHAEAHDAASDEIGDIENILETYGWMP